MSAVMSMPRARAESISAMISFIRPQFCRPAALRCQISTGTPACSPIVSASLRAGMIPSASLRMCEA